MIELVHKNLNRVTCEELNQYILDYFQFINLYYEKNNPLTFEWKIFTKNNYDNIINTISSVDEFDLIVKDIVKHDIFEPYYKFGRNDLDPPTYLKGEIMYGDNLFNKLYFFNVYEIIFDNISFTEEDFGPYGPEFMKEHLTDFPRVYFRKYTKNPPVNLKKGDRFIYSNNFLKKNQVYNSKYYSGFITTLNFFQKEGLIPETKKNTWW